MAQTNSTSKPESAIDKQRLQDALPEQQPAVETPPVVEVVEAVKETEPIPEVEEQMEEEMEQPEAEQPVPEPVVQRAAPVQPVVSQKNKFEAEIEEVLQEDLTDLYLSMSPEERKAFKIKGEETVSLIHELVRAAHINTKKIFQLIRTWLHMIPGVNRFFLEQEAKIKTDKVLLVTEEEKRRGSKDLL